MKREEQQAKFQAAAEKLAARRAMAPAEQQAAIDACVELLSRPITQCDERGALNTAMMSIRSNEEGALFVHDGMAYKILSRLLG